MNLEALNPQQRKAAETLDGPVLILAGAGSGKTRALTYRVANLIDHGIAPWNILAITFTNKAAKEMRERVSVLAGERGASVWVSTFHAMCARILRRDIEKLGYTRSFTIYDDDDQTSVVKDLIKHFNIDDKLLPAREIKSKISDAKNKLLSPDEWFQSSEKDFGRSKSMIYMMRMSVGCEARTRSTLTICSCARWSFLPIIRLCWRAIAISSAMCM
ncbi:MAG: UvrD-helicase domain-containing protein [Clostridia bacterium]